MRVRVAQAAQAAKMMGKLSAGMERLVTQTLQPKVDWREVLRKFVQRQKNDTRSWAKPNRRMATMGMYLPSISGEVLGEVAVAIDCSVQWVRRN
jgi:predicted metal-dependent peptidase